MRAKPFSLDDLATLTELVSEAWLGGRDRDWSARAGTLEWSCTRTADHAVDTVLAPGFFLASPKVDDYPDFEPFTLGPEPTAEQLVDGLATATRILSAVVATAEPAARAVIWRWPQVETRTAEDFVPRAALELIIHAHDVCAGLDVAFEPPADLCQRLREHTRSWPMWTRWQALASTDDPWGDLLFATGRITRRVAGSPPIR